MESTPDISRYSYLWTTEAPDWVLMNVEEEKNAPPRYLIINRKRSVLIIEKDAIARSVEQEMLKRGAEVVDLSFLDALASKETEPKPAKQ